MDDAVWQRVKRLFHDALQRAPAERTELLATCSADVRVEVEGLLAAHEEAGAGRSGGGAAPSETNGHEAPGSVIDRYKLLQRIGEGGFGVVFMAEQTEPVRRHVALKVIKLGMDTKQVVARFEAERQALALMEHPHIAKVLDGGATQRGRPYFVMELVKGVPITEYCDDARLTVTERLELFQLVCSAVQHAHQKGIIHRDLKPNNVLVTERDGTPVPKVIDFGIAKATDHRLTEKTLFTEFRQMVGTPEYMSPEQTGLNSVDVDTRTDIYSLGVLLYELMTGTKPFELADVIESGYEEMLRHVRDVDPPKPSTRVSTLGQTLAATARHRRTETGTLGKSLRGDLDWIVMKALEKDRTRRYETANGLAEDVGRHLRDEPVLASPPSASYRIQKYVRRHGVAVTAAATVVVALTCGLAFAYAGYREASDERAVARAAEADARREAAAAEEARRREAEQREVAQTKEAEARTETAKVNEVISLIREMLGSASPLETKGADYTVRQLLDDFDRDLGDRLKDQPEVEATLRATMGEAYWALGLFDKAEPHLETALEIRQRVLGEHELVAESLGALAKVHHEFERDDEAQRLYEDALAMNRRVLGDGHPSVAVALRSLAELLYYRGAEAEAERLLRKSLAILRRAHDEEHPQTARTLYILGWVVRDKQAAEAEQLLREAVDMLRKTKGDEHPEVAQFIGAQAGVARGLGNFREAETLYRDVLGRLTKSLGDEHPQVAYYKWVLSYVLVRLGDYAEAERLVRESLDVRRRVFGNDHYLVTQCLFMLRNALHESRNYVEAERVARENLDLLRRTKGEDSIKVSSALSALADTLSAQGKHAEAESRYRNALLIYEKEASRGSTWGPTMGAATRDGFARVLRELGKLAEAERLASEALGERRAYHGDEHPDVARSVRTLALVVGAAGRPDDAERLHHEALAMNRKFLGDEHKSVAANLLDLAELLLVQTRFTDAEPLARECLETSERVRPTHWMRFSARSLLGASLAGQGEYAHAEPLLVEGYEKMDPPPLVTYGKQEALEQVIQLYEAWGKPDEAAKWRAEGSHDR